MPVGEMLRRMDSAELTEWMAYIELKHKPAAKEPSLRDRFADMAARTKKR